MRHALLVDTKIPFDKLEAWMNEDRSFWKSHIGVTPSYTLIEQDYATYPTFVDEDGHARPTNAYLKSLNDTVVQRHGEFAFDFIIVLVHEDNWRSKKLGSNGKWIRGTNFSYVFGTQCLEYCMWDKKNPANTFGTIYHERHHSFDAIIKQETGVLVEPLLGIAPGRYDYCTTHGECDPWQYIRWKENTDTLAVMAPYLRRAFSVRQARHDEKIEGLMEQIIALLKKKVYLLKMLRNQKEGVKLVKAYTRS